jgi:hypothetical protein
VRTLLWVPSSALSQGAFFCTLVTTGFFAAGCPKSSKVIAPLMPAILAGVPPTFALHLGAYAINEQVRLAGNPPLTFGGDYQLV